ncbi:hypothetical protein [Streptomyces sp. WMMB303]|uniref:hypothetical protein n=1 Tax=Streptomyces sp. WMMB303 TaxID=3034154 RepID=UPI0023EB68AB|nr:hypothetical protein [Streptomyces sp. WMMB303]MDF4249240.1 hypothetical protein [Streptomyces sp. WMMB303]
MSASQDKPLPLPDFDQLPAGAVEHRIRPLAREDVQRLLDMNGPTRTGHRSCTS